MLRLTLKKIFILVVLVSMAGVCQAAARQGDDSGAAKAQQLLRQIAAERDALKTENARQKEELSKLTKDHDKYKKQSAHLKSKLSGVTKNLDGAESTLQQYKKTNDVMKERLITNRERTKLLIDKFRNTIGVLRQVEAKNIEQSQSIQDTGRKLHSCEGMNSEMYKTGVELLSAYDKKGFWQSLLQADPVTGLTRVKIENLIEKYHHRLSSQRANIENNMASN